MANGCSAPPFLQTSYPRLAIAGRICRSCCDTHDRAYYEGPGARASEACAPGRIGDAPADRPRRLVELDACGRRRLTPVRLGVTSEQESGCPLATPQRPVAIREAVI